mgnify:CR=1 FL=1
MVKGDLSTFVRKLRVWSGMKCPKLDPTSCLQIMSKSPTIYGFDVDAASQSSTGSAQRHRELRAAIRFADGALKDVIVCEAASIKDVSHAPPTTRRDRK